MGTSLEELRVQIERIEESFGEYSNAQKEAIVADLRTLAPAEVENLCTEVVCTWKFQNQRPPPMHIKELANARKRKRPSPVTSSGIASDEEVCTICLNTGLQYGQLHGAKVLFQCSCPKGPVNAQNPPLKLFPDALPLPFPKERISPSEADMELLKRGANVMWEKAMAWNQTKANAIEFWKNFNKPPQIQEPLDPNDFDSLLD